MELTARTHRARFGAFDVDLRLGQLHKHGIRLKLQDQPFQVLALLLEHPGDLVTREEFRQKLWPADTFVDFDTGLNSAIKKLRDVLGDSAEEPRYVATLPRRGYRFIAPVAAHPQGTPQTQVRAEPGTEVRTALEATDFSGIVASPAPAVRTAQSGWAWPVLGVLLVLLFAIMRFEDPSAAPSMGTGDVPAPPSKAQPAVGRAFLIKHPSANPEANELLQRAMILMRFQFDPLRARSMLERALQLDPNFTEARAYYAATYVVAVEGGSSNDPGDIFRAEEELRRALKEDPQMAMGHAMLGAVHFFQGQMDLAGEESLRAVRLAPGDMGGEMWFLIRERFLGNEEAMRAARRLIESEPLFWPARYLGGELLREQGKTAEAVREHEKVLEQDPQNSTVLRCLARSYLDAGNLPEAWQTLARLQPRDARNFRARIVRAQLHALEGKRAMALNEMDEEALKYADLQPFAALDVAEVYAVLGETDRAIEWLDRSMRKGDDRAAWLRIDPLLANVRQHPRFKQILNSMEFRRQQRVALPAKQSRFELNQSIDVRSTFNRPVHVADYTTERNPPLAITDRSFVSRSRSRQAGQLSESGFWEVWEDSRRA
jgi:DNA-binding winged helix-turn-helix (wHTH) protein/Tfp pilus assembly protein PilF